MNYAVLLKTVLLSACLSLMAIAPSHAAKMYKVVDAQGNVSFSQFPPKKSEVASDSVVEAQTVSSQSETSVSTKYGDQYCGKIELPRVNSARDLSRLARKKSSWQRDLENSQVRLNKQTRSYNGYSNSTYRLKSMGEKGKHIRDLRCALKWISTFNEKVEVAQSQKAAKTGSIQKKLAAVESRRDKACGFEPEFDPTAQGNKRKIKEWKACNRGYNNDIRKLKRMLNRASNNY